MPDSSTNAAQVDLVGGHPLNADVVPGHDLASLAHYVAELAGASVRPHVFRVEGDPQATWISTKDSLRRVPHEADEAHFGFEQRIGIPCQLGSDTHRFERGPGRVDVVRCVVAEGDVA